MAKPIVDVSVGPSAGRLRLEWGLSIVDGQWVWEQPHLEVRLYCEPFPKTYGNPELIHTGLDNAQIVRAGQAIFKIPIVPVDWAWGKEKSQSAFYAKSVTSDGEGRYFPLHLQLEEITPGDGPVEYYPVEWPVDVDWLGQSFRWWVDFGYRARGRFERVKRFTQPRASQARMPVIAVRSDKTPSIGGTSPHDVMVTGMLQAIDYKVGVEEILMRIRLPAREIPEHAAAKNRLRILFVAPDPIDERYIPLNIAHEWRRITRVLATLNSPVALVNLRPPTFHALSEALASRSRPYPVIHLIAHGTDQSIILEQENGESVQKSIDPISAAFARSNVELVILNICESEPLGQNLIDAGVPHVIVTRTKVPDHNAAVFAEGLYAGLAAGQPVVEAFKMGCARLDDYLEKPTSLSNYRLLSRDDAPGNVALPDEPDTGPRIFNNQLPSNTPDFTLIERFFGRKEELVEQLCWWLSPASDTRFIVLAGIGGYGKSALALEAARRYGWNFPGGVIVETARGKERFAPLQVIEAMDAALGTELGQTPNPEQEAMSRLNAQPHLLVLDNLETVSQSDQEKLVAWFKQLDPTANTRCIFTMRPRFLESFRGLEKSMEIYEVEKLSEVAAIRLLEASVSPSGRQRMQATRWKSCEPRTTIRF